MKSSNKSRITQLDMACTRASRVTPLNVGASYMARQWVLQPIKKAYELAVVGNRFQLVFTRVATDV